MDYRLQRNYENTARDIFGSCGEYGIPVLEKVHPEAVAGFQELRPFNYCKSSIGEASQTGIHFFIEDYQFVRVWNQPARYIHMFRDYKFILAPDFSIYADWPMALQIYNHYRKHWLAAYYNTRGVQVVPTISWGGPGSFAWCFDGEPKNSVVAVSSVGIFHDERTKELFVEGYRRMKKELEPAAILFYGKVPDECQGPNIPVRPFTDKFKKISEGPPTFIGG